MHGSSRSGSDCVQSGVISPLESGQAIRRSGQLEDAAPVVSPEPRRELGDGDPARADSRAGRDQHRDPSGSGHDDRLHRRRRLVGTVVRPAATEPSGMDDQANAGPAGRGRHNACVSVRGQRGAWRVAKISAWATHSMILAMTPSTFRPSPEVPRSASSLSSSFGCSATSLNGIAGTRAASHTAGPAHPIQLASRIHRRSEVSGSRSASASTMVTVAAARSGSSRQPPRPG